MVRYYGPMHDGGGELPPDLEKTDVASATAALNGSKDSYTKTIRMPLIKNRKYKFWFTYLHENPDTKEVKESDSSPIVTRTFDIPNLTKAVQNLTLTPGVQSYGVKFDLDPLSIQEDVIIFESLTSDFASQSIVYVGTSTNVSILTTGPTAFAPRWVKVRSRDKWDDDNISEATAGPVTPLTSEINTTIPPDVPTNVLVSAFNETSDPSNYTGYINVSWTAPATGAKGYNVGVWENIPGSTVPNREFPVEGTSSKIEGLFVGKSYYIQVKSLSEFNTPSAWVPPVLNYPAVIPGNTAVPGKVTISGVGTPRSIVLSWTVPLSNANLVTSGGYYIAKLYSNSAATGTPLQTKTCYSNSATFAGLTTGSSYWVTIQPYTSGSTPVAGELSLIYGPLVPIAVEPPDIQADFILANNQFQVGGTSGANDVHLSAYPKIVDGLLTNGRIYIGGPETSGSVAVGLYNSNGTPFYADNLGRFSLGDKLTWSGGSLNVIGTIDVSGASTFSSYILSGATNSAFIGIGKQVPYRASNVLQSGTNGLTGIVINNSATANNSDYIKSDGTFRLGDGNLIFNGSLLSLIGNIEAKGGTFTGNLRVTTGSIIAGTGTVAPDGSVAGARVVLQQSGLYAHDGSAGDVPTVSIIASTGSISATKGIIGGWTLETTGLSSSNTKIENSGNITLGDNAQGTLQSIIRLSADNASYRMWVGSQDAQTAANNHFAVTKEGKLYAAGAAITGNSTFNGSITVTSTLSDGTSLTTLKSNAAAGAVAASDLIGVTTRVTAAESSLTTKESISNVDTKLAAKAAAADLTSLSNVVGTKAATQFVNEQLNLKASLDQLALKLNANAYSIIDVANKINAIDTSVVTINGGKLTAGSVDAVQINAGAITAVKIAAGTITSEKIGASEIKSLNIASEAVTAAEIKSGTITALEIEAGSITVDRLSVGTLTGFTIRTSSGTQRVELNSSTGSLRVINGGTVYGHIASAAGTGILMHYGSTYNDDATAGVLKLQSNYAILAGISSNYIELSGGTSTASIYLRNGAGGVTANLNSLTSGSANMRFTGSQIYYISSTRDSKTNIQDISFTDDQIKALRPRQFQGKEDLKWGMERYGLGLIAEEVAEIEGLDTILDKDKEGNLVGINYDRISIALLDTIKRILNRLDALEA
jgi:hypothetical protein